MKGIVSFIAILILCSGCVAEKDLDTLHLQFSSQNAKLARENNALKKQLEALRQELNSQTKILKEQIVQTSTPVRSTQANLWAEIETLRVQIATLSGQMDAIERKLQKLNTDQTNSTQTLVSLSKRVSELEKNWQRAKSQLGLEGLEDEKDEGPEKAASLKEESKKDAVLLTANSAQELYKNALESFYARKYDLAQSLWDEFIHTFPKNKLVPNAYFWQGECFFQMGDFARAVLAYQEVISKFPQSNKLRPSMLKQGMAFYKLGKKKAGQLVLKDLIKKFPHTVEARRAKGFLASAQ
ncbi:tol-pal system protein YbgF [Desulfovulcanus sp.]